MKKLFAIIMTLVMVFSMAACGSDDSNQGNADGEYPTMKLTMAALDKEDTAKAHDLKIFMIW